MSLSASSPTPKIFPKLRQDLLITKAPQENNQSARYVLSDPVRHKFFHLGQDEVDAIHEAETSEHEPNPVADFLTQNELIADAQPGKWKGFAENAKRAKQGILSQALHGYLFFRIPLLQPHRMLDRLWPVVSPLFTKRFMITSGAAGLIALFFISRHWQEFMANFAAMLTVSGLLTYALAFVGVKILHEAGHAFMAHRFAVPVPTIGVAFMMFAPVLYTETSAAWRLDKRRRMLIGAAGMLVEVTLALWASLLWVFLPDGVTRSIVFAIATTGWFLTLAVNLNPLMRFDGYFLASDLVSMPNLQDRSFNLARWAMRELLFAPDEPKPEEFSHVKTAGLIAFAIATWIYRLFLYLGIALLVYHFAVKLLGIFLFIVEIAWFIVLPLWRETKHWWQNRTEYFSTMAARKSLFILLLLLACFFAPLSSTIHTPALLIASQSEQIYPKSDATIRISHLEPGKTVKKGDVLIELDMPDLAFELAKANASIQLAKTKISRLAADAESRSQTLIIQEEMARALQKRKGIEALAKNTVIRAPFDGVIENVEPALKKGRWIGPATRLAIIKSTTGGQVHSLATDQQIMRMREGAKAQFIPDDRALPVLSGTLVEIDSTGTSSLPHLELSANYGGLVATHPSAGGAPVAMETYAKLKVAPSNPELKVSHTQRGIIHIEAKAESLATKTIRQVAAVLIMESGF